MAQIGQLPGGGRPFGDIFIANTPTLDRFAAQLYQDQRQRESLRAKQQQMLDEEFAKNMSGIRDVDIPELTKKYGDFKLANQMLMRQKGGGTPEQQLDLLRKKASVYDIINQSKGLREEEKDFRKGIQAHPDRYDDNAYDYLRERMQTPLSRLGVSQKFKDEQGNPVDLLSGKSFLYKGTDYDMGKALKTAAGTLKNTPYQLEEEMAGKLGKNITNYQYLNDPITFKNILQGQFATNKGGRAAAAIWESIPEDQKMLIDQMYEDIPITKWEQITGKKEKPVLTVFNPENKAELLANFYAKQHAINNSPVPLKTQQLYDKNAIMDRQLKERQDAAYLRYVRGLSLIDRNKGAYNNADYDVLYKYEPNVVEVTPPANAFGIPQPSVKMVPLKEISIPDQNTITSDNKVYPKIINGVEGYERLPNGDWRGDGDQIIKREDVARMRSKETSGVHEKRGLPRLKPINEKSEVSNDKWKKYKRN